VHEQDNYKLNLAEAGNRIIAREIGINTYDRISGYDFSVASEYWESTRDFWTAARAEWTKVLEKHDSVTLRNDGQSLGREILGLADELHEGKVTIEQALETFHAELAKALAGKDSGDGKDE
jgi:hypothetical protein